MGQKTNPIGLRVGISLKWAFSWFNPSTVQKSADSAQHRQILLKKGVVSSRGGAFLSSFDERLRGFFKRYFYVPKNQSRRFLPISIQYRKGANNFFFMFITYIKLRGRRIKRVKKIKRRNGSLKAYKRNRRVRRVRRRLLSIKKRYNLVFNTSGNNKNYKHNLFILYYSLNVSTKLLYT